VFLLILAHGRIVILAQSFIIPEEEYNTIIIKLRKQAMNNTAKQ
jgi:hypothetical protein